MKRLCAWISRHTPLPGQRQALSAYQIVQINPPGRLWSAADAIVLSQNACGGWPDLFVVVMPLLMLQTFIEKVDGRAPIIRAVINHRQNPIWTGQWEQITGIQIVTQEWTPSRKELT